MRVLPGSIRWAALLFVVPPAPVAYGVTTQYDDRATFEGLVSMFTVINFDADQGFAVGPIANLLGGQVLTSSTAGPAFITTYGPGANGALEGSSGMPPETSAFEPITLAFSPARYAVGFDNLDLTQDSEVAILIVHFAGGLPDLEFSRTDHVGFSNPFLGVISTEAITGITVYSADPGSTTPGVRPNLIDNLTLGPVVPAPGTILMGALVAGLSARRRR